jgi:hypothetical protein
LAIIVSLTRSAFGARSRLAQHCALREKGRTPAAVAQCGTDGREDVRDEEAGGEN